MSTRLSHSSVNKYLSCPKSYELHYISKFREKTTTSALLFGSAMDASVNAMLLDLKAGKFGCQDYKKVFDAAWSTGDVNKRQIELPESLILGYSATEMDWEILRADDLAFLRERGLELFPEHYDKTVEELYQFCATAKKQKAFRKLRDEELKFLNLCNWHSLRRKGHLMLEAYERDVIPKIKEVVGVQVQIGSDNGQGDSMIGYIDAVLTWETGDTFPIDNKTSAMEYSEDSVKTSQQLGTYCEFTGYKKAAFIVMLKNIAKNRVKTCEACGHDGSKSRAKTCDTTIDGKRCGKPWIETVKPEARIQIIIDTVPERLKDNVVETFDHVARGIRAQVFPRNLGACEKPWGKCAFYKICHEGKYDDVEKMEK